MFVASVDGEAYDGDRGLRTFGLQALVVVVPGMASSSTWRIGAGSWLRKMTS
jgi:hypothetical protein